MDVAGWNAKEADYAFAYTPEEKETVRVLVKCSVLGSTLCVAALSRDTAAEASSSSQGQETEPVTSEFDVEAYTQDQSAPGDLKGGYKDSVSLVAKIGVLEASLRKQFSEERRREGAGDRSSGPPAGGRPPHYGPSGLYSGAGGSLRRDWGPARYVGADDLVPPGVRAPAASQGGGYRPLRGDSPAI